MSNNNESNLLTSENRIIKSTILLVEDNDKKLKLANNLSLVIETISKQCFNDSQKREIINELNYF